MYFRSLEVLLNVLKALSSVSMIVVCVCRVRAGPGGGEAGAEARQLAAWRVECELGLVADARCPVDGGWGAWGPWSACRGPCDAAGHRRRARRCANPPPSKDGLPCSGADEQTELCYQTNCTVDHFRALVSGDAVRSQALRRLETVPALTGRCLQKLCGYEAVEAALASDNSWQIDPEAFWNSLQCVKHNLGCPVMGEWGSWGGWRACGARCGAGRRWRVRRCDTPPPSSALQLCAGAPLQAERCRGEQCAPGAGAGRWAPWAPWSPCSDRCAPGVRRRQRACLEGAAARRAAWGTHCVGPYEEFEACVNPSCSLDGGWSGWSGWGACSQSCGAGRRLRSRSCTRPAPAGRGQNCVGAKTEFGTCYLSPCDAFTHVVAVLNGDSYLQYDFKKKQSTLFHFYVRFLPLSPHGTLVRRGPARAPLVRLSLQRWHACVDARGGGGAGAACPVPRTCSPAALEPAAWHSALVTVSNEAVTLRLDDAIDPIKAYFPCDPELPYLKMNILIGERLHGEIQEIVLNFIPLNMTSQREQRSTREDFSPSALSNVAYEKASIEEAYLPLHDDQYVRLPCFDAQEEWRLELTIKPKRDSGTILFLKDDLTESWLLMELQNMRLKLKLAVRDFRAESSSTTECPPDQWLDIMLIKNKETNAIEASLNAGERLHVVLEDVIARKRRESHNKLVLLFSESSCDKTTELIEFRRHLKPVLLSICNDEFFVGGTPAEIGLKIHDELTPFSGIVASISINNVMQDLHGLSIERNKRGQVQLSARTASVSGYYHETAWGSSNRLSLTCLHARSARAPHAAQWLYLDTAVSSVMRQKPVRALDDGKVLKLVATADNDLRGFYTCRAHTNKRTANVVTYGVTGKVKYNLSQPDTTTALAVVTSVMLVIATLGWLIIEGLYDLRIGFGFFRDAHLTPEQEAEAVCSYIDDHAHLVGSAAAVRLAKARARYRARQLALASKASFAAQEPEGLMQIRNQTTAEMLFPDAPDSLPSEPDSLPAAPAPALRARHAVFRCEPSYVSSGPSPRRPSSSSGEPSPRALGSRMLLPHRMHSSRRSLWAKKHRVAFNRHFDIPNMPDDNLPTIKSSTIADDLPLSPAQKILKRFQELRCDD